MMRSLTGFRLLGWANTDLEAGPETEDIFIGRMRSGAWRCQFDTIVIAASGGQFDMG
jgi:hypothetical protein